MTNIKRENDDIKLLHNPEAQLPENRCKDGKCDPVGRFWVDTMSLQEAAGAGSLYTIEKALTCMKKAEEVTTSNGITWSSNNTTFYYIDKPTFEVVAYNYNIKTGDISNRQVAIAISKKEGLPDGMAIDREGVLWIAHWDGWQRTRWNQHIGEKLLSISLAASRINLCTFGGDDLHDMYITSTRIGLTENNTRNSHWQVPFSLLKIVVSKGWTLLPSNTKQKI